MGNVQTTPPSSESAVVDAPPIVPPGYFGVRVTGDAMREVMAGEQKALEDRFNRAVNDAYKQGYERSQSEKQEEISHIIKIVQAKTLESIQDEINTMHSGQFERSEAMAQSLKQKLSEIPPPGKVCDVEEGLLAGCLKEKGKSLPACSQFSSAYLLCVNSALKSAK